MSNYSVGVITPIKHPDFAKQAINNFLSQDYANKKLVLVFDRDATPGSKNPLSEEVISLQNTFSTIIRFVYLNSNEPHTIGYKRNLAVSILRDCDIICHMDADDFYAHDWISYSVDFLCVNLGVYVTGLNTCLFYQAPFNLYKYHYTAAESNQYVIEASMVYWRNSWAENNFPNTMVGEGEAFCNFHYGKIKPHNYHNGMVAMIHTRNTASHKVLDNSTVFTKLPPITLAELFKDFNNGS